MSNNVFKPQQVVDLTLSRKVRLQAPEFESDNVIEEVDEYTGPTADDLRREAESFKQNWDQEKALMLENARREADEIKKEAERNAFEEVKKKTDQSSKDMESTNSEIEQMRLDAHAEVDKMIQEAKAQVETIESEAFNKGYDSGHSDGFEKGHDEVKRLVDRIHVIINGAIDKRIDIINETETQLVDLVLMITKKVVKVISENQKNVVINNVVQSLRKLKSRGNVAIHVNLEDLELTTDHVKDFMEMVENVKSITVLENTSVDRGGCIIETDFGQIDARISSQLKEIEEKILELVPIKTKGEK